MDDNTINVADCCRACLRIDCTLTSTDVQDSDSVKLFDKLLACVGEVSWLKEGLSSLICSLCVDRLRVAYDFRMVCLQSDQTLNRYLSIHDESKEGICLEERPLTTLPKFAFSIPTTISQNLNIINGEQQNAEYIHLKHFLDNDEELAKQDELLVTDNDKSEKECSSPDENLENIGFVNGSDIEKLKFPVQEEISIQEQEETPSLLQDDHELHQSQQILQYNQNADFKPGTKDLKIPEPHDIEEQQNEEAPLTPIPQENVEIETTYTIHRPKYDPSNYIAMPLKQIIKRTTGIQVRPPLQNHEFGGKKDFKGFMCIECGKSYKKKSNLRIHMRTHTGEKPFECKYCEKRFYHSSHLREHIRRHTGEKPFQCSVCNKRFTIKGELTMHMKSHTGEKPYACNFCNRRCLTSADLKIHMRTHTGEKPYECTVCGKKFASTYILNSHIKTHTGERPYSCSVCHKTFTQSSHLNVHHRKHTGEKFTCKICDSKFTHSSQLTVHMREHTGRQPYKCTVCEKVCNYASELQSHMMKHTGEKFACLTCDKKFTSAAYLSEHSRTHTGENLSTCQVCDRQFTRAQYLEKHMRTHTGEKPFSCFICSKKFTQSSSLKVHLRIHTGEKPFSCTLCEKKFNTSSDLTVHGRKHKKEYTDL